MFNINLADVWFRTADLWSQKQLLHQLSQNHCPRIYLFGRIQTSPDEGQPYIETSHYGEGSL